MTDPAPRIDFANLPAPAEGILVTLFITVRKVARSRDFYSRVLGGTVVLDENPCMVKLSNSWIIMNPGGPPTPDKPGISVVDYQPGNTTSIFPAEDAKLAIAHPDDVRLAIHAITMLDAFFGILHANLHQNGIVEERDDSKWKEELARENNRYRVLRDCAYALKHGELWHKKPRLVRRPDQIVSKGARFRPMPSRITCFRRIRF